MFTKPYIDIIIPVYNSEKFISRTIRSVLNQTFKNWRLIIIEDGSNDNTKKILTKLYKKFLNKNKIVILKNKINKGQGFSRNRGLNYSKSKFVAFLDSDDTWNKKKLENQIKFMLTNNFDFTYTDYKIIKNNKCTKIIVKNFYNYEKFILDSSIITSSIILRRKILKKIYFKNLPFLEDYFFKCQILKKNITAHRFPGAYTNYLVRNDSLQSNRFLALISLWSINKNLNYMNFFQNIFSIYSIVLNSLKKYGFR